MKNIDTISLREFGKARLFKPNTRNCLIYIHIERYDLKGVAVGIERRCILPRAVNHQLVLGAFGGSLVSKQFVKIGFQATESARYQVQAIDCNSHHASLKKKLVLNLI